MINSANVVTKEKAEKMEKQFVVSIEGNIGSGKSSMLKFLEKQSQEVVTVPEPVKEWCDLNGHNLLLKLYENPSRWSFQFQSYIQLTRLRCLRSEFQGKNVKLLERSIQNNRFCFLELAKREGSLTGPELSVLYSWYDFLDAELGLDLDLIVYLRADPKVSYSRMKNRGRSEEADIPIEYIEGLHSVYEDWLIYKKLGNVQVPVLVIDANEDRETMIRKYKQHQDKVFGNQLLKEGQVVYV